MTLVNGLVETTTTLGIERENVIEVLRKDQGDKISVMPCITIAVTGTAQEKIIEETAAGQGDYIAVMQ